MKNKIITLMVSLALFSGNAVIADGINWSGTGGALLWSNPENWENVITPTGTDYAIFGGAVFPNQGDVTISGGNATVGSLQFLTPNWNISGASTLALVAPQLTVDGTITNVGLDATQLQGLVSISNNITVDAQQQNWLVATGGTLSLGTVARSSNNNDKTITIGGYGYNGTVIFGGAGDNNRVGLVINSGLVIFDKTGANRAFGGNLTLNSGTVRMDGSGTNQLNTGNLVMGSGVVFDLNGKSGRMGNLEGGGLITSGDVLGSSTLTINGVSSGRKVFSGTVSGHLSMVLGDNNSAGGIILAGEFLNEGDIIHGGTSTQSGVTLSGTFNNTGRIINRDLMTAGMTGFTLDGLIGGNVIELVQESENSLMVINGTVSSSGGLVVKQGRVNFGQNGSILGGGITIESGTVNILNKALGGAGIDGGLITLGDAANSGKLAVLNVNGSGFSDVVNQIHVVGTGTRIISATSYSLVHNGAVTLFDGADLYLITNNPNGSQLNFYGSVSGTGNLVVQANSANANGNSWIRLLTNSVDIDGTITNNGAGSSGNLSRLETQISAVIGDKVRGVVQDSVNSALTLSGSNIYRGDTQVLQGTLNLGNVYAVQNSTVNLSAGVMLGLTVGGGANTYYLGGLAGDSNVNVGANSLNVGANNASTVYNGALVGNGNLTKVGAGTLTLTGASTYDGNTTISGGVLLVNGSGELTNTGGVYVNTGGTFRYDSVVAFGRGVSLDGGAFHYNSAADMDGSDAVLIFNSGKLAGTNWNGAVLSGLTINTGKVIAPGNSIGIAGTESQTWGVGGAYEFELGNVSGAAGADWDLLNVSGVLDISSLSASSFTLQLTGLGLSGFNAGQNYDWDFVHFASLTGVFDGDLFTVDAVGFGAAYDGEFSVIQSGGNILALHYEAIPEPSVLALLGIGGVILLIARRRK